jgi:hypothetical protein
MVACDGGAGRTITAAAGRHVPPRVDAGDAAAATTPSCLACAAALLRCCCYRRQPSDAARVRAEKRGSDMDTRKTAELCRAPVRDAPATHPHTRVITCVAERGCSCRRVSCHSGRFSRELQRAPGTLPVHVAEARPQGYQRRCCQRSHRVFSAVPPLTPHRMAHNPFRNWLTTGAHVTRARTALGVSQRPGPINGDPFSTQISGCPSCV